MDYTRKSVQLFDEIAPTPAVVASETWNGWVKPYFDAATAARLMETANAWNDLENVGHFEWGVDQGTIINTYSDGQAYEVETITIDGTIYHGIGAGAWMWEICE